MAEEIEEKLEQIFTTLKLKVEYFKEKRYIKKMSKELR